MPSNRSGDRQVGTKVGAKGPGKDQGWCDHLPGHGAGPGRSGYLRESITRAQDNFSKHPCLVGVQVTGPLQRPEGLMAIELWPQRVNAGARLQGLSL